MSIFWSKFDCSFKGEYKDKKPVDVYYTFEVKRNWTYLFIIDTILVRSMNHCIQDILNTFIEKKWMHEDEGKLELLNKRINSFWQSDWNPKGLKIRNIKITHLI